MELQVKGMRLLGASRVIGCTAQTQTRIVWHGGTSTMLQIKEQVRGIEVITLEGVACYRCSSSSDCTAWHSMATRFAFARAAATVLRDTPHLLFKLSPVGLLACFNGGTFLFAPSLHSTMETTASTNSS
eukprot:453360-Pelagomonas_calceolata.AAC.4